MYKKLVHYIDENNFGNEVTVYKSENDYFVVVSEFGRKAYSFLDVKLERIYPADTYIRSIGFVYEDNTMPGSLDCEFDFDFSKNGFSPCPEWLKELIKGDMIIFKQGILKKEKERFIIEIICTVIPVVAFFLIFLLRNDDLHLFFMLSLLYLPIFLLMMLFVLRDLEWFCVYRDRIESRCIFGIKNSVSFSKALYVEELRIPLFVRDKGEVFYFFNDGRKNNDNVFDSNSCHNNKKYNLRIYKSAELEDYIVNVLGMEVKEV